MKKMVSLESNARSRKIGKQCGRKGKLKKSSGNRKMRKIDDKSENKDSTRERNERRGEDEYGSEISTDL